jgi:hypothetical protein
MFTTSLINLAVLAYFSVSSGHEISFDFHADMKSAAKVEEKVVIRESPLSETCGLGLETVTRPDDEIVALRSRARGLKSALSLGEQIKKQTSEKAPFTYQWKKKFDLVWDEEGGFYLDQEYHPALPDVPYTSYSFFVP